MSRTTSLQTKATIFAIGLCLATALGVGAIGLQTMWETAENLQAESLSRAVQRAERAVKAIGQRVNAYGAILAADPAIVAAVERGDRAELEKVFTSRFAVLTASDGAVSVFESSRADGQIVIRAHNPGKFGDDKSHEPSVRDALQGKDHSALTISPTSGDAAWLSVHPLRDASGKIIGALSVGAGLKEQMAAEIKAETDVEVMIVSQGKTSAATFEGHSANEAPVPQELASSTAGVRPMVTQMFGRSWSARALSLLSDNGRPLSILVFKDRAPIHQQVMDFLTGLAWKLGLALLALTPLVVFIVGRATSRLVRITDATRSLAGGDLAVTIDESQSGDELGDLARSLAYFRDKLLENQRMAGREEQMKEAAAAERGKAMARIADDFESHVGGIMQSLAAGADEMEVAAGQLSRSADQAAGQAGLASSASSRSASNVQAVAAATEELTASMREIAQRASQSATIAAEALAEVDRSTERVRSLSEQSARIGAIVDMISQIAAQTNMLALNATIEAARAGEAGRGFAVVANEVKTLADRTAKATTEIAQQISGIVGAATETSDSIAHVGSTIRELDNVAGSLAAATQQQGAAIDEIARNVTDTSAQTAEVSRNAESLSMVATQTGGAAQTLLTSSGSMKRQSESLREQVAAFMQKVRVA